MTKIFRPAIRRLQFDNLKSKIENPKWAGVFAIALTFAMCGVVGVTIPQKVLARADKVIK